ncbi:MAG: universal stress protein [Alphaproteobacteria bacterium]|nr:universal stress protein [Alphaproteobacteria bacterium]
MSYKDLLVVLDSAASARARIEIAAALAERFAAHLVGLYPLPMPEAPQHFGYYDPALLSPFFDELRARARDAADKTREVFEHIAGRRGVSAEWREIAEGADADPALHARYADLTILGQLDPDEPDTIQPRPEQVTLVSGRPILVVPYTGNFSDLGRRVVIGWNASREAARAVNDAMPLLTAAETVTVLTIDPREGPQAHGEVPGADISLHLARHGVKAEIERTVSADLPIGEILLSRVADLGADLLVMGAYGHSRARELLLGGATRSLLRSMTLPVLMSH